MSNTTKFFATAALALVAFAGQTAFAAEATEFTIPVSTLSRAEAAAVEEGVSLRNQSAVIVQNDEATQFAAPSARALRDRAEVRAEGRAFAHRALPEALYLGA